MTLEEAYKACTHYKLVHKKDGYQFIGYIVAVFHTVSGQERMVVEHAYARGLLHIFNLDQFEVNND